MTDDVDLDHFLKDALALAEKANKADKVLKIADGEILKSPNEDKKPPSQYVKAIRFHSVNAVFDMWNDQIAHNKQGEDIYIGLIVVKVQTHIKELLKFGEWEWTVPGELTTRRRIEEAADARYYPDTRRPAIVCITDGYYRPNPFYLSPETREAMREVVNVAEMLR